MNLKKVLLSVAILVAMVFSTSAYSAEDNSAVAGKWSREKAWKWYNDQPWQCGFNYVPANAISYTEMWMDYSFDPKLIDAELKLAEDIGFNCLRVVFSYVVWEHDPAAFKARFEKFLEICDSHGIKVMPAFFDDCKFGPISDPVYGKQPDVVEGWYANGWTPSPGHRMVRDVTTWHKLEEFVTDVVGAHKNDSRILCWDLYNEPNNDVLGDIALGLVDRVFKTARKVNPDQPLTSCSWNANDKMNEVILRNSDIITFHSYAPEHILSLHIEKLKTHGRPLICTEWLNRGAHSVVESCLPLFYEENVGCLHWGLVNGKTQTDLNWGHQPGDPEPLVWQHDLFYPDGSIYSDTEIQMFKDIINEATPGETPECVDMDNAKPIVLTAELVPQVWKYTTDSPNGDWSSIDYNDSKWKSGEAGFGTKGVDSPRIFTEWNTESIWMRKEFTLDSADFSKVKFRIFHDEEIWIYINGKEVLHRFGWTVDYLDVPMLHGMKDVFKVGKNVISVRCKQTSGAQAVDVGLMGVDF